MGNESGALGSCSVVRRSKAERNDTVTLFIIHRTETTMNKWLFLLACIRNIFGGEVGAQAVSMSSILTCFSNLSKYSETSFTYAKD